LEERLGIDGGPFASWLNVGLWLRVASSGMMRVESAVESCGQGIHPLPKSELQIMNIGATGKPA
jgi:hypothetical protein